MQPEALEFAAGRGKLALAAIDDDQVGETDGDKPVISNRSLENPQRNVQVTSRDPSTPLRSARDDGEEWVS